MNEEIKQLQELLIKYSDQIEIQTHDLVLKMEAAIYLSREGILLVQTSPLKWRDK